MLVIQKIKTNVGNFEKVFDENQCVLVLAFEF